MKQYFFLGKPNRTDRQRHARQQIEALGDHADNCRNHGSDTGLKAFILKEKRLDKQYNSNRYDRNTHAFYQLIQRTDHL